MYAVSDAYKIAIKAPTRKSTITGMLTTAKGKKYVLDDSVFIRETFYTTNRAVNNSALEFGCVYAGECGFKLISNIDRYTLYGARIDVQHNLYLPDGTVESVPLGVYWIDQANRQGAVIDITALDAMANFDITVDEDVNGVWVDMIKYIAGRAGVELAQTDAELLALHANADEMFTIKQERIDTYRDCLAYFAMLVCAFATIDRFGELKFIQFKGEPVDTNDSSSRLTNSRFSDYVSTYGSVKMRFIAEENYYPYLASDPKKKSDLLLDMGDNPVVQGLPEFKQRIMDNILATLIGISYVPSTLYIASNPAYELGDMIQCDHANRSEDSVNTYIMKYKFEYRKKEALNSYGENPKLQNISDRSRKQIESLEASIASKDTVVLTYTNASGYTVKNDIVTVVEFDYSTFKDCQPIFIATIPFHLDVDATVEFHFFNTLVEIEDSTYKGHYEAGDNIVTISYYDKSKESERRSLRVGMIAYADTSSPVRVQDAKIATMENAFTALSKVGAGDVFNYDQSCWELGSIDGATGADIEDATRLRMCSPIPVVAGTKYKYSASSYSYIINDRLYKDDKTYHGSLLDAWTGEQKEVTIPDGVHYLKFIARKSDNTTVTLDDLDKMTWRMDPVIEYETVAPSTAEPTATIDELTIKAVLYAQGVNNGGGEWDGTLDFTEYFGLIDITQPDVTLLPFNASVVTAQQIPTAGQFTENFGLIDVTGSDARVLGFAADLQTGTVEYGYTFDTSMLSDYDGDLVTTEQKAFKLRTVRQYTSVPAEIDSGKMCVVDTNLNKFETVESVVVE